jgi:serine/threonine-protein kinase
MSTGISDTPAMRHFRGRVRSLSEEQQEGSARNLGYVALALNIWGLFGLLSLGAAEAQKMITPVQYLSVIWTAIVTTALSVGIFLISRSGLKAQTKLDLGLAYQFLGSCTLAAQCLISMRPDAGISLSDVSYVIIMVTVIPVVALNKFGRSFAANVASACSLYVVYAVLSPLDVVDIGIRQVGFASGPVVAVALIIMIPVYFHNKLRTDLKKVEKMGSYELVDKIGEGAMGEVWRARHNLLAHESAIKLIKPESLVKRADESSADLAVKRFEREARATAALKSPNTVNLYDFGVTDAGTCYYVMELLDGLDLDTLVERFGPVEPNRAVYLLRQMCYSLIEAHEANLIHRDIKPANVFACRLKPYCDVIKVLDFGLVKRTVFTSDETKLTTDGMVAGTPAFLSPEQAKGEKDVDGRTDIYAVGCVAYWLLTGCQVFEADTPIKVILAHVGETPIPPSKRTELEIPPALEAAILKCLEKDPSNRPQSARELEEMLAAVKFEKHWSLKKAEQWWDKHLPSKEMSK